MRAAPPSSPTPLTSSRQELQPDGQAVAIRVTHDCLLNCSHRPLADTPPALHTRACGRLGYLRHTRGGPRDGESCLPVGHDLSIETTHDCLGLGDWHGIGGASGGVCVSCGRTRVCLFAAARLKLGATEEGSMICWDLFLQGSNHAW